MTPERDALDPQRAQARAARRLLREHRDDRMAAWSGWRALSDRQASSIPLWSSRTAANVATAKEFVRFLVAEGWLAHYLNFSGERMLPAMPKLLEQPFWLDPSDPHRMAAVMQAASRPLAHDYTRRLGRSGGTTGSRQERVWAQGDPPRRRRGHQPRAGGRRGDRPDQGDPERVETVRGQIRLPGSALKGPGGVRGRAGESRATLSKAPDRVIFAQL